MLAERFKFTQQVGRLKAASGMPPSDPERERTQIARLRALAEDAQLDPAFAEKWFNFVVAEVIHHHERLATGAITTPDSRRVTAVWTPGVLPSQAGKTFVVTGGNAGIGYFTERAAGGRRARG